MFKTHDQSRIAATPGFSCLRRFKHGRRFKQWTGDDSKALMKVYLPAICGLVPDEIVKAIGAFLDFCYLVRRNDFDDTTLSNLDTALARFHQHREIFKTSGVRPKGFSLPRQHSLMHYRRNIELFGAPNGLCSSITESRHITAVKKPWRRSNHYKALGQMLVTNQRLDKLSAARADFVARGMLSPSLSPVASPDIEDDGAVDTDRVLSDVKLSRRREPMYPRPLSALGNYIGIPALSILTHHFLRNQLHLAPEDPSLPDPASLLCSVFHSAVATFYAPSDISGIRGMRREWIRCTPSWRKGDMRRDCALVVQNEDQVGFRGMSAVRIRLFFSFEHAGHLWPCALVEWFKTRGRSRDTVTGMWVVEPVVDRQRQRVLSVLHLDSFYRAAHLIPVYGSIQTCVPLNFNHTWSLDVFRAFYVSKYADHHTNEILFS